MVRELIAAEGSVILVADADADADADGSGSDAAGPGALLACCHLQRRAHSAYLGLFAVRPGMQGRGLGTALL